MVKKVLLVLAIVGLGAWAQEAATQKSAPASAANEQEKFYRLTFVVRELENERVINSRGYFVIASTGSFERSSLRAGQDVPVGTSMQWHQFEAGISIDTTRLKEVGDRVALHIVTEVRSLIERPRDE